MKKILLFVFAAFMIGCIGGGQQPRSFENVRMDSYGNSFNAFVRAVENKDITLLNHLSATHIEDFDLLLEYDRPKVSLVPKQPDGAFGVIDKGTSMVYYLFISDNDILREVRVLQIQRNDGKYRIWNYTPFEISDKVASLFNSRTSNEELPPVQIEKSHVTDYDPITGIHVGRVNLWSSPTSNRRMVGYCVNNEEVEVIGRSGDYVKVRKKSGVEGWFLADWIK